MVVNTSQLRFDNLHPFVQMIHSAFAEHYNVTLTPDTICQVIAQNFSLHINENAENFVMYLLNMKVVKKLVSLEMVLLENLKKMIGQMYFQNLQKK